MGFWGEVKQVFAGEISLSELTDPHRAGDRLRQFLLLVRETIHSITRHQSLTLASALAYQTLVAMVPVLAIGLAVVAMLEPAREAVVESARATLYREDFIDALNKNIPDFAGKRELIDSIRGFAANARAIAGIGFLFLFGAAYALLNRMEVTFNTIWQVRETRPLVNRLSAYLATIIVVPLLMTLSVYLSSRIALVTERFAQRLPGVALEIDDAAGAPAATAERTDAGGIAGNTPAARSATAAMRARQARWEQTLKARGAPGATGLLQQAFLASSSDGADGGTPAPAAASTEGSPPARAAAAQQSLLTRIVLLLASILTTTAAMTALYYFLPYTPVQARPALTGGIFAGIFLELAKFIFHYYAAYLGVNYTRIYGPLLAIPLFLLWIWLVWVIVLIGAEVAFTAQNFRDLAARSEIERRGIGTRLYLAVRVAGFVAEAFQRGEEPTGHIEQAAERLKVPPYLIREIVAALVDGGVLRRLASGRDAVVPAKDIHRLTVLEILNAAEKDALQVPDAPAGPAHECVASLFRRIDTTRRRLAGEFPLAALVEAEERERQAPPPPAPQPPPPAAAEPPSFREAGEPTGADDPRGDGEYASDAAGAPDANPREEGRETPLPPGESA